MSNLQIIERLCQLLETAGRIIAEQAELLAMHGIRTDDGGLEAGWKKLLEEIEETS